ncbi:unconventional myosin-Ie isoform X2 [Lepeophtheirus salmonis]|nr:unconventional myosin-Ie-like isoform X2 [Lepeophtheirus salmonis]XP_040566099.1 unconventional myosin-Ie-like isoform X2 [Lepeophtheirus salmonis]
MPNHKRSGLDDMTLLSSVTESAIMENMKKRYLDDWIFTYIGQVLISVNPFKHMSYFTQKEVDMYQGAALYENPPHVYALADNMYRNMTIDNEHQCVIISGESGAGKTVAAKYIMNYLSQVSGGGESASHIKSVILQSNPLLEAFGNAKTIRNNNSSRFGKYVEILFEHSRPVGGQISNFLLEKSRVVRQNPKERNFHIFYQFVNGLEGESDDMKSRFGVAELEFYNYLNEHACYHVDDTNDQKGFEETMEAMTTMGMSESEKNDVLTLVSGILHVGNVIFSEGVNDTAIPADMNLLDYPAYLLQIDSSTLATKLTSRVMETKWGSKTEIVNVTCNVMQSEYTRDALAKGLYSRLFDYLVQRANGAMKVQSKNKDLLNLGILDIYGFEIFGKNGFEQFCINYVNEKLQQIFIELTLKAEQEEYVQEGIEWKEISYFNNAIVCELIESKKPSPGVLPILNDICSTQHGVKEGSDMNFKSKLRDHCSMHKHFQDCAQGFIIHHYAGVVTYNVDGFCERNKDLFHNDLIEMMQGSNNQFIRSLFPETTQSKKRPITAGTKIISQANKLVSSLMSCNPSYIRCIKPNETKKPRDWENARVMHQIEYLGLKENVRVTRAGFVYRRPFDKFLYRYAILTKETWPHYHGDSRKGVVHILNAVNMKSTEYQMGKTKLFIKAPESLMLLEERREKKFDVYARILQKAFKKHFMQKQLLKQKEDASDLVYQRKERRRNSLERNFYGDYLGLENFPDLKTLVGKRERILFAQTVKSYDKSFRSLKCLMRDLIVVSQGIFIVAREPKKKNKEEFEFIVRRKIEWTDLYSCSLSTKQDDFVVLHVKNSYDSLLQIPFKTEFISIVNKTCKDKRTTELKLVFQDKIEFTAEKSRKFGGGKKRILSFKEGNINSSIISSPGSFINNEIRVEIGQGLPNTSRPSFDFVQKLQNKKNSNNLHNRFKNVSSQRIVPPPMSSVPISQPKKRPAVTLRGPSVINTPEIQKIKKLAPPRRISKEPDGFDVMAMPAGGVAKAYRESVLATSTPTSTNRPVPGGGRPKPHIPQKPSLPKIKALYNYTGNENDEMSLVQGMTYLLTQEDDSGWWSGKTLNGKDEGFFPGNYVEKL